MSQWSPAIDAIIQTHTVITETGAGQKVVERGEFLFINNTRLVTYESIKGSRFKYGYQWMNATNETIFRWDNTPHFPDFETFLFHRHVGADEDAEPFASVTLADVLTFIAQRIISG